MSTNLDEPIDSLTSKVIETLLSFSSISDPDCSALVAECLGILGAVNPIRLDHLIYGGIRSAKRSPIITNLSSPEFIVELIERLKNSLLSDQRSESETANYAIQVVVKVYAIFSDSNIKEKLSGDAIKSCELCRNTSYSATKKINSNTTIPVYELFKMEGHHSYIDWLDKFYRNLVSTIKDEKIQETLHACSYIFRYNQKLAEFLLPHTIIHIIIHQPQSNKIILNEIEAILSADIGVSTQDLDSVYNEGVRSSVQTLHFQCANMVFCTMDAIHRLACSIRVLNPPIKTRRSQFSSTIELLEKFTNDVPRDKLALQAAKCRSHARALCYYEQYLYTNKDQIDKHATSLQRLYMALDDPYEAAGIEMVRTSPTTLKDDIANYEASGRFDKASVCYSACLEDIKEEHERESFLEESLRCISCQGDNMRLHERSRQLLADYPQYKRSILPAAIESSWKLGKWIDLSELMESEPKDSLLESISASQGYLLSSLIQERHDVPERLKLVRQKLMKPLSIAIMDRSAYFRGYQNLLVLHSIEDFALSLEVLDQNQFSTQAIDENIVDIMRPKLLNSLNVLFETWSKRNKLVQPLLRSLEPLAAWQRSIAMVLSEKCPFLKQKLDIDLGRMWLKSADSAREARCFDKSFFCLTQAQRWFGPQFDQLSVKLKTNYYMEQAKLDWDQGDKTRAIKCLQLSLQRFKQHPLMKHLNQRKSSTRTDSFPQLSNLLPCDSCTGTRQEDRESFAQLKMLLTHFSEEAAAGIPETLFYMYEECVHLGVNQEETYFKLARYYDKLLAYYVENPKLITNSEERGLSDATQRFSQNLVSGDREDVYTKLMEHSIIAFGHSLKYGSKYLNESMPRMLNIWYDLGSKNTKTGPRVVHSRIENTIRFIDELRKNVPPYYFMAALSLILTRVCHCHSGVSKGTSEILILLLTNYAYQISWHFLALLNDKDNKQRSRAATEIQNAIKRKAPSIDKIIRDTHDFSKILMEVALNYGPRDSRSAGKRKKLTGNVSLDEITTNARRFDFTKCKLIPPVQSTIRAIYPTGSGSEILSKHAAFPDHSKYFIRAFQQKVRVFNSLQQPRAIYLDCENGKSVQILCKSGDDLRKDSRCVEFFNLLNRILRRNSLSNARFFEIPTFLVLPLNQDTGIIEMLPNCDSIRNIVEGLYKERFDNFQISDTLPKRDYKSTNLAENHVAFRTAVERLKPSVLPTWFLRKFTEPTSWYMARLAYTRSTAVISMGGYIIGLGDRHLDNILLDTCTGKVVHVDFNLLFHQGENLAVPECVPFRATHNVVAAFGPMGTEGNFRKVCEITMRIMRKEKDALLTVLKPFMHDPCSEWIKSTQMKERTKADDENRGAKSRIEIVERKLKGFPRSMKFKPLTLYDSYSVEAQVDNLVEEATDAFNLSQMYHGWCPHI